MTEIHDVYARLVVEGADAALAFYGEAFGGTVTERFAGPDGRVQHAMLALGRFKVAVKDAGDGDPAPASGAVPVVMALYVDDPDAVAERVVAGGGTVVHPVADQDYGERGGRVRDPWGHQWMLARPL